MKKNTLNLPLLPLRGLVVFPYMIVHLDAGRKRSVAALEEAMVRDRKIMLSMQIDGSLEDPKNGDVYQIGTIAEVRQLIKLPGGSLRILVEGIKRAKCLSWKELDTYDEVEVEEYEEEVSDSVELEALTRAVVHEFEIWVKSSKRIPSELIVSIAVMEDAGRLADLIAGHLNLRMEEKQEVLELVDVKKRLTTIYGILLREMEVLNLEQKIGLRVRNQLENLQKEHYLREKIKAIHEELGDSAGAESEISEFKERLKKGNYPLEVKKVIEKEISRMDSMSNITAEAGVIRAYIDCLLSLPWEKMSEDVLDLKTAAKILDEDHYGLEKVKERVLEFLAVQKLVAQKEEEAKKEKKKNKENSLQKVEYKAPILCLVGPPGVGKTSLATSIARATGRKFVRASLGGVRDEAEIRGHRRTYVGAMAGRIIAGLRNVGTKNPVFLLDEVDKMAMDYKGDPSAALLEVLDPAQNATFSDHYVDLPFDLSKVLWIVTANDLGAIPRALRDRMEIINLSSYTEFEKLEIAKRYLVARQLKAHALSENAVVIPPATLKKMITDYTREAGVRELERIIGHICRKAARKIIEGETKKISIHAKELSTYLGIKKYSHTKAEKKPQVGVATGMAWTVVGGDILPTEAIILKGKGKLTLTGQLGDVMKESAQAGLSYIRSRYKKLKLKKDFYETSDIHLHLPEGAIPKDGPSAGITMATAMISALTNKKIRSDVAMTGEITLRGRVLAIGGLKEKVLAAYREGITTIIFPKENVRDLEELPKMVKDKLEFVPVESMDDVLGHVFEKA